jgi:class 3 adenylate cyclase
VERGPGGTLAFLFTDLRGFTDFVDRRGATASAELLTRYRKIVRSIVALHTGSEVKTEGDSFYVVFPSASEAVRAAIEIREACRSPSDGDSIPVGIGVHAGEAVSLEGNFVGTAVNVASRLCSMASAGEVLVSGTVRDLTRSVVSAEWQSLGQRALRGIADPVATYRYLGDASTAPLPGRARSRPRLSRTAFGIAVAAVVLAVVGASVPTLVGRGPNGPAAGSHAAGSPASAALGTPAPTGAASGGSPDVNAAAPLPLGDGLAPHVTTPPGRYVTTAFQPRLQFTLWSGWEATVDQPDALELRRQTRTRGPADGLLSFARVQVVFDPPCATSPTTLVGSSAADLVRWLASRPYLTVSRPQPVTAGGLSGLAVEAAPKTTDGPRCPLGATRVPDGYYLFPQSGGPFFIDPSEHFRVSVFDLPSGTPLTLIVEASPELLPSVESQADVLLHTLGLDQA